MILGTIFKNSFGRAVKEFAVVSATTMVSVSSFSSMDSTNYVQVLQKATGTSIEDLVSKSKDDSKDNTSNEKKTTINKGLNFSLIDRIPDVSSGKKGYIKEVLNLSRDANYGEIAKGKLPAESLLGIWYNEVGYDNEELPDYYFKASSWKKGSKNFSLAGYTYKSSKSNTSCSLDSGGGYGFNEGLRPNTVVKAKVDPKGNSRKYADGDAAFAPDAVCNVYNKASSILNKIPETETTSRSWISGVCNNRGSINQQLAGIGYSISGGSSYYNWDKFPKKVLTEQAAALSDAYDQFVSNGKAPKTVSQSYCAAVAITLKLSPKSNQWFLNSTAVNFLLSHGYVSIYKELFPKAKDSEIKSELNNHKASSLASSIKQINPNFSGSTSNIYRTSSDYQDCPYYGSASVRGYGYVWFVSETKDTYGFYKHGKNPNFVMAFDGISFRYTYDSSIHGQYLFGYLLKKAGVDSVDPTNLETYCNVTSESYSAAGVSKSFQEKAKKILVSYKQIKWDELSEKRLKVLKEAVNAAYSKKYVYELYWRNAPRKNNAGYFKNYNSISSYSKSKAGSFYKALDYPVYGLDCSGFIYHCYSEIDSNFPLTNAAGYKTSSKFKNIARGDLKPCDIAAETATAIPGRTSGHIILVIAKLDSGLYETIEASMSGTYIKANKKDIKDYYVFRRYKGIDK